MNTFGLGVARWGSTQAVGFKIDLWRLHLSTTGLEHKESGSALTAVLISTPQPRPSARQPAARRLAQPIGGLACPVG
ncbi:MAG: hypothetical protein ACK5CQ_03275, partial [Cyanobacteriota bacterium]